MCGLLHTNTQKDRKKTFTTNLVGSYLLIFLGTAIHNIRIYIYTISQDYDLGCPAHPGGSEAPVGRAAATMQAVDQPQRSGDFTREHDVSPRYGAIFTRNCISICLFLIVISACDFGFVKVWNKATVWWGEYTGMWWDSTPQRYNRITPWEPPQKKPQ